MYAYYTAMVERFAVKCRRLLLIKAVEIPNEFLPQQDYESQIKANIQTIHPDCTFQFLNYPYIVFIYCSVLQYLEY